MAKKDKQAQAQDELRGNMVQELQAMRERAERAETMAENLQNAVSARVEESNEMRAELRAVEEENANLREQRDRASRAAENAKRELDNRVERHAEDLRTARGTGDRNYTAWQTGLRERNDLRDQNRRFRARIDELRAEADQTYRELQATEREFDVHKEYTKALAATLMTERQYGPTPGAAGTEHVVDDYKPDYLPARRVVVYPLPPATTTDDIHPREPYSSPRAMPRYAVDIPPLHQPYVPGDFVNTVHMPAAGAAFPELTTDELVARIKRTLLRIQLAHHMDQFAQPREELWRGLRRPEFG